MANSGVRRFGVTVELQRDPSHSPPIIQDREELRGSRFGLAVLALAACQLLNSSHNAIPAAPPGLTPSPGEVIAASKTSEWRALDPENTLYMDFPERVGSSSSTAPNFSPNHVANVKALSREGHFVNGAVTRVQDNFVSQWAQAAEPPRPPKTGVEKLNAEFTLPRSAIRNFDVLPDPDTYAPEVGFINGMSATRFPSASG